MSEDDTQRQSGSIPSSSCSSGVLPSNPPPAAHTADTLLSLDPLDAWNENKEAHVSYINLCNSRVVLLFSNA